MVLVALPLRYPHEPLGKHAPVHASILTRDGAWGMIGVTCMVRRRTARRIGFNENSLRKCIRPLSGEWSPGARWWFARACPW